MTGGAELKRIAQQQQETRMKSTAPEVVDTRIGTLDDTLSLAVRLWIPPSTSFRNSGNDNNLVRCIAYPGWLDNVGSFENLAPILCTQLNIIIAAVDPPGCGWSDHRNEESAYADYEEPPLIADVADGLGWTRFGLIGHSRGGAVCAFASALFRERVLFFIALDSGLGLSGVWAKDLKAGAPNPVERMRLARKQYYRNRKREVKIFASLEAAIEANATNEVFKKSKSTAANIVMRHIRPHASGGFTFTHDMRTYGQAQYLCVTEEQTRAFLREIACPVLKVHCKPESDRYSAELRDYFAERTRCVPNLEEVIVPGGHHVHSDDAPATASAITKWLSAKGFVTHFSKM